MANTKRFALAANKWSQMTYQYQTKHAPVDLGDILVSYYAQDSVNKIDSREFKGLYRQADANAIIRESDFETEKAKWGEYLSLYGKVLLAVVYVDNQPQLAFFEVGAHKSLRGKLMYVNAHAGWTYKDANSIVPYDVYYRWWIDEDTTSPTYGRVFRSTVYDDATKGMQRVRGHADFMYPKSIDRIPAWIIRNNPKGEPDMVNSYQILLEMNVLGSEVSQEWEFIKTQLINLSTTFGQGKKSAQREAEIVGGNRISDSTSPNSKFQQAFQTVISGSPSLQQLIQTIQWWEDKALKYSFGGRELESTGSNKHSMQVGMFAQAASEYAQVKKEQRQRDYNMFFNTVLKMFLPEELAPITYSIKIQDTAFEEGKKAGILQAKAQQELLESQQAHFDANAEKALADANLSEEKAKLAKEQAKLVAKTPAPVAGQAGQSGQRGQADGGQDGDGQQQ